MVINVLKSHNLNYPLPLKVIAMKTLNTMICFTTQVNSPCQSTNVCTGVKENSDGITQHGSRVQIFKNKCLDNREENG